MRRKEWEGRSIISCWFTHFWAPNLNTICQRALLPQTMGINRIAWDYWPAPNCRSLPPPPSQPPPTPPAPQHVLLKAKGSQDPLVPAPTHSGVLQTKGCIGHPATFLGSKQLYRMFTPLFFVFIPPPPPPPPPSLLLQVHWVKRRLSRAVSSVCGWRGGGVGGRRGEGERRGEGGEFFMQGS